MMMMMMKTFAVAVLIWCLNVSAHPTWPKAGDCKENGPIATIEGWPVLIAFKIPKMSGLDLQLRLSRSQRTHTNISLSYVNKESGVVELKVEVESEVTPGTNTFLGLTLPQLWTELSFNLHRKQLVLMVKGHSRTINYTTRTLIDFPHYRGVDTVTSFCPSTCMIDVDLQCLYENKKEVQTGYNPPFNPKASQGTPSWPFFLLAALFLLVLLLFVAWRLQRRQIRRRQRKAEDERKGKTVGGRPAERPESVQVRKEGRDFNGRVQYSTILKGYDGPCTDDE